MSRQPFIFSRSTIGDFNKDGFDSVESEDYSPGFGCIPITAKREPPPLPEPVSAVILQGNAKGYEPLSAANEFLKFREEYIAENGLERWDRLNGTYNKSKDKI